MQLTTSLAVVLLMASVPAIAEEPVFESKFNLEEYVYRYADESAGYGTSTNVDDAGAFRFECEVSHLAWDDPIVNPGEIGGSMHLHHFFGNTLTDGNSTYSSLRNSGGGSCAGGPVNRSAYWFPAMIRPQNNKVVKPDFITVYNKTSRRNQIAYVTTGSRIKQNAARKIPRGLRYVTGFNLDTNRSESNFAWTCEDGSSGGGYNTLTALAAGNGCPVGKRIILRVDGPDCWDGVNLDSANHRSHMSFRRQDGWGNYICPATHPQILPQLALLIWWSHNGPSDFGQWYLSSDRMPGHKQYANGESFHFDWFGAWDTSISDVWQAECNGIGGGQKNVRSGVAGQICDGRALVNPGITLTPTAESERYLDIPENRRAVGTSAMKSEPSDQPLQTTKSPSMGDHDHMRDK